MSDETAGTTTYDVNVKTTSDGTRYLDGMTVTEADGTSVDYPFRYENEDALEASRAAADEAARAANSTRAAVEAAEEERKSAEEERKSAETKRETDFKTAKDACEDVTGRAKTAAGDAAKAQAAASGAAELANAAAGNADTATAAAEAAAKRANAAADAVSVATLGLSPQQLRAMVRMGSASQVLRVGDQLNTTFTWDCKEYPLPLDVVHHFDGSDADHPLVTLSDGSTGPVMALMPHFALPPSCCFDSKEALFVPDANMLPGQYDLIVEVNYTWGPGVCAEKGSTRFTFTTTEEWPAGCQVLWNASYNGKFTSLTAYENFSGTVIETVPVAAGSGGTLIGTANEQVNGLINNIQRACEGSDDWATSGMRRWANAHGTDWDVQQTIFDRPHNLAGKPGLLDCLSADLVEVLASVSVKTQRHGIDGGDVFETVDTVFPPSARQHYFSNYLGASSDGYAAEGIPFDYFKMLAKAAGLPGTFQGWQTYQALITYSAENHSVACICWLRSAIRDAAYAYSTGIVYSTGSVSHTGATYGHRLVPVLLIG